jgi:hypothetical protein
MLNNWLRLGTKVINMDHVKYIEEISTLFRVYLVNETESLDVTRDSEDGRALAHWLKTSVGPKIDGTKDVTYSSRVY